MNPFRRGYNRIVYLTGIALLFITVGIEYFQYRHNQQLLFTDLKNRLDDHTSHVNLRVRTIRGYVNGLKTAAENTLFYINEFGMTSPLFAYLKNDLDKKSYHLEVTNSKIDKATIGNLIGLGSIDALSNKLKNEINMALLLNTFFEISLRNNRGAAWVYYTSKNHFQNLYPWVPSSPTSYHQTIQTTHFFQGATPEKNPNRLNFWTTAYEHGAASQSPFQKGIVVTNSSPVYAGDEFLGSVSIDLSLSELTRIMKRLDSIQGSLLLVNKDHQVLATNGMKSSSLPSREIPQLKHFVAPEIIQKIDQEMRSPSGQFFFHKSSLIYVRDLRDAPWCTVYLSSTDQLLMTVFWETVEDILIITAILIFVVGLGYLLVIRDFISPAQKLVDHIEKENRGITPRTQHLPLRWRPWFEIVSRIFSENRALMADLENRVKQRTKQYQQKNSQLEKALIDLKKAQNQIIIQEKLASLGALTAGIAHEIKNPLNFILNFSDLSLDYLQELTEKDPNKNDLLTQIEQNLIKTREHAERADSIVKGMLLHARGDKGEITPFDLNHLLDEAITLASIGFQDKENYFKASIFKEFDPTLEDIQGSQQDLVRVFLNIVNNACFAMHEKQEKLGDTYQPKLTVTTQNRKESVEIIFEDNGPGMSPSVIKKIFTPFFTTKEAGKGTGLGLSLSYDIITHQHHGAITVESKMGGYTRFIIVLPKRIL